MAGFYEQILGESQRIYVKISNYYIYLFASFVIYLFIYIYIHKVLVALRLISYLF